jgi:hypothetical protein
MKTLITTGTVALALFTAALAPSAKADDWNKKTVFTVQGGAVQIQGMVLEPGKYVLKLDDSPADRRILEVFNADETKLETTIFAEPAYRLKPASRAAFTFYEMSDGQPPALNTLFYPGNQYGLRFSQR